MLLIYQELPQRIRLQLLFVLRGVLLWLIFFDHFSYVFDFELDPAHLALLDALDEGLRTAWDPTDVP